MTNIKKREYGFETKQLHIGQETPDPQTGSRAVPIHQTTSYVFKDSEQAAGRFALTDPGNIYGRLTNPTQEVLEQRIAALEGGQAALAVASGAAALYYTFWNLAQIGDNIVASSNIYGGTYNLLANTLEEIGIRARFVDTGNLSQVAAAIDEKTKAIFVETLGNPNSDVADIKALAQIAHENKIPLIVDNTFGTPYLIRPIELGADIVVHSATKFIGGHGTSIGGIIVDGGQFDWAASGKFPKLASPSSSYHGLSFTDACGPIAFIIRIRAVVLRDTGACISPFNAFLLLQGLETLSLRVERHVENTLKVVEFLSGHPNVAKVNHPSLIDAPTNKLYNEYFPNGAGSIFSFQVKGSQEEAWKVIDNLEIFSLLANVADAKSLVIHPSTTTHSQLDEKTKESQGIFPNTIRLSIGLETVEDLIDDLDKGLNSI